jgi:FlaA1/EpsC-like NDP-sugar epimerase
MPGEDATPLPMAPSASGTVGADARRNGPPSGGGQGFSGQASGLSGSLLVHADGGRVSGPGKESGEVNFRRSQPAAVIPDDEYETFAQDLLTKSRGLVLGSIDVIAWFIGLSFMAMLLASFEGSFVDVSNLLLTLGAAGAMQVAGGLLSKLYLGRWVIGSVQELTDLAASWLGAAVAATAVGLSVEPEVMSASAFVGGNLLSLFLMVAPRMVWRRRLDSFLAPLSPTARRVIVFGAGEGGEQIVRSMIRDAKCGYAPVALLDDNPTKRHRSLYGVEVEGTRHDLVRVAQSSAADLLLVAIPSAGSRLIGEMYDLGRQAGLEVRVLPAASDMMGLFVGVGDIRPLSEQDLLGRDEVQIDIDRVTNYVTGRRVLVTGAGGSIGSELCRQLHKFAPSELIMLDRDENALEGRALLDDDNLVVADIRDRQRMEEIMIKRKPEVVFHAAALKHVTLLEQNPDEGLKTNALGTYNVLRAAHLSEVSTFVNVSTDKAADPCNTLGYTKQLAERFTAAFADREGAGKFVSVRFGNVLGSRGSVLPTFRAQIEAGGPVTVTDPNVTRYFMTIPEATRLVMEAGAIGRNGEIMILDMGEPVRIVDMAERLIAHTRPGTRIEFTGLRPGEKLHEILLAGNEVAVRRDHERIMHTMGDPMDQDQVDMVEALDYGNLSNATGLGSLQYLRDLD